MAAGLCSDSDIYMARFRDIDVSLSSVMPFMGVFQLG
eukprot:CAMPEP_0173307808 /NCGR_PEP_ID=MMETSP1143-20121109/21384_1 /TAXON_ID=483371 /ORGANISM="non described non described, Strain CCMP2298" /LENGTH=36 /DNA_ID= /DNA_START= /DNA_END= /DNA_ORIENTATION=